jgi:hypothetical protein
MIALIAVVGLSHRSKQIDRSGDVATTPFQLGNVLKLLLRRSLPSSRWRLFWAK